MSEPKQYVVRAMKARCSCGTMDNYLNVDVGHGVMYDNQPLLNANDHLPGVNLTPFGNCQSHPVLDKLEEGLDGGGFLATLGKLALGAAGAIVSAFNKCDMKTPLPWLFTNDEFELDGAGTLTVESQCACVYGGTISIVVEVEAANAMSAAMNGAADTVAGAVGE